MEIWLMQGQSTIIVLIILIGIYFRKQRRLHVRLMSVAMIWDVVLILQIELSRSAILKASNALTNSLLLNIHVAIAASTVILYGFMVHSGRKLLKGENSLRTRHRYLGWTTLVMRILTYATSFWAVTQKGSI